MEANELRIGNYVYDTILKKQIEIKATYFSQAKDFEPIPLTEEWLMKFNEMKKFGGSIYLPIMNLKAELHFEIYGNEIVSTIKSDFANLILDRIKHVHQLQNLYFALTNEELTI
jgi:hypothetical protein